MTHLYILLSLIIRCNFAVFHEYDRETYMFVRQQMIDCRFAVVAFHKRSLKFVTRFMIKHLTYFI
jgi:hypothetical protein